MAEFYSIKIELANNVGIQYEIPMNYLERTRESRRKLLHRGKMLGFLPFLPLILDACGTALAQEQMSEDEKVILESITKEPFVHGSILTTTLCPRKLSYEDTGDSTWLSHLNIIKDNIKTLAAKGIRGGRVAIFPFELSADGQNFDFTPIDTFINIMEKNKMVADLCLGPFDYPYSPGVRVPKLLQTQMQQELVDKGIKHITISMDGDPAALELSLALRDYALRFLNLQLEHFKDNKHIGKFYIGNEYPDAHGVEGVELTMSFAQDFMMEVVKRALAGTDKSLAMNTNKYPNDPQIKAVFGPLFQLMGKRGVMGVDSYFSRESQNPKEYGAAIDTLREAFPDTTFVLTEEQCEPYVTSPLAGKPWAYILARAKNSLIVPFYTKSFPPSIKDHILASNRRGIKEIGLWEPSLWLVAYKKGYTFPLQIVHTMASTMARR